MADLFYLPARPVFSPNGVPIPGATLNFYVSGTTTPAQVYADEAMTVSLGSVVTVNAAGQVPPVYLDTAVSYRLVIRDADGAAVDNGDFDPYVPADAIPAANALGDSATTPIAQQIVTQELTAKVDTDTLASATGSTQVGRRYDGSAAIRTTEAWIKDQPVSVRDFFLSTDPDWTNAFERALANADGRDVYMPKGNYTIRRPLYIQAAGQVILGDGPNLSIFVVPADFATGTLPAGVTTAGVIVIKNPDGSLAGPVDETRAGLTDLGFQFLHADTSSRAALTRFPYAIATYVARPFIGNIVVNSAWNGIWNNWRAGGMVGGCWEVGAYNQGWFTDGAYDTILVNFVRFWPYGCNPSIYYDGQTVGATIGADDALHINHLFTIGVKLQIVVGAKADGGVANGPLDLSIGGLHIDNAIDAIDHRAGNVTVASGYATCARLDKYVFRQNATAGSSFIWSNFYLLCAPPGTGTPVHVFDTVAGNLGTYKVDNVYVRGSSNGAQAQFMHSGSGTADIRGVTFDEGGSGVTRSVGFIGQSGSGNILIDDCRFPGRGSGSGSCVSIATNGAHVVNVPNTGGWGVGLPPSISNGNYTVGLQYSAAPIMYFETPGSSSFAISATACYWTVTNNVIDFALDITATVTNPGTSSGSLQVFHGIAYPPLRDTAIATGIVGGVSYGTYKQVGFTLTAGTGYALGWATPDNNPAGPLNGAFFSSGKQVRFQLSGRYRA